MKKEELLRIEEEEHRAYHRRITYVIIVILLFLFGGAIFYHFVENWRYLDALYFATATMTTVGYGDIVPKTDIGRLFTIFYAFTGVAIALYGLSIIAAHFVEIREEFWLERLSRIRIKHHTQTFWDKFKNFFGYEAKELVEGYNKSSKTKK